MINITKGLDVPLSGAPRQEVDGVKRVSKVALLGQDFVRMKPTMLVKEGDEVALGQALFEDKRNPGVLFTSPASGKVLSVMRGAKRVFHGIEIEVGGDREFTFQSYTPQQLDSLTGEQVRDNLVQSGLWVSLRQRPYSKTPPIDATPRSIFVTAMDTNPHAPDPQPIIQARAADFVNGLRVLHHLTPGTVFLCKGPSAMTPGFDLPFVKLEIFDGPHPAGLPGTHIHHLDPVGGGRVSWYINYQDVIAIGHLFTTGRVDVERTISIAGPVVTDPRLVKTRLGANITEIVRGELAATENRVISGSVLSGRKSAQPFDYLGRYHLQVSALKEGTEREFLGWQTPGFNKFSLRRVFASAATPGKQFAMTTSTEGSKRAMVPIGVYEDVMPLDVIPTFLLRALITKDTQLAQQLGALELDEEDLSLCTFVCPSKYEYGTMLRQALTTIEEEG